MEGELELSHADFSAMQEGRPFKKYRKVILGKVFLTLLNPFSGKPEGVVVAGNPNDPADLDKITIDIWSVKEHEYFKRLNRNQMVAGNIVEVPSNEPKPVIKSPNTISNEEIGDLLNKPFLALRNKLAQFTAVGPVYRVLTEAERLEKSEKILNAIRARMSELELQLVTQE